jgi:hypothetical protein
MTDILRKAAVLVAAVAAPALSYGLFAGTERPFEPAPGGPTAAEPAGYAFAIWGPIFLLAVLTGLYQLRPARGDEGLFRQIGWALAVGYGATALWLVFARFGPLWATAPTIAAILVAIGWSLVQAARAPEPTRARRWLVLPGLGLFAGWVTAATYVNIAEVLPRYGFDRFGLGPTPFAVVVVAAATLSAALFLERTRGNLVYAAAVAWALAAVIVANQERGFGPLVQTAAGVGLAVLAGVVLWARRREARS